MNKPVQAYFITGTGTEVGKTIITAGIAALSVRMGKRVSVMKPVQTGVSEYTADLATIHALVPGITPLPPDMAMTYCYQLPASPHLAARNENTIIDPARILQDYHKAMALDTDLLLIEGAGGVSVPLREDFSNLDLIEKMKIKVIVTALSGLGTINHSLLTINSLQQRKIDIAGIIFNKMPLNPGRVEKDNVKIIEKISKIPVLGVIGEFPCERSILPEELCNEFDRQWQLKQLLSL